MVIGGLAEHHDQGNPAEDRDEQQELPPARVAHVMQPTGTDGERRNERPEDKDGAHERDDHRDEDNDQPGEIKGPELATGSDAGEIGVVVDRFNAPEGITVNDQVCDDVDEVMIPLSTVKVAVYGTSVPALLLRSDVKVTKSPDSLTSLTLLNDVGSAQATKVL